MPDPSCRADRHTSRFRHRLPLVQYTAKLYSMETDQFIALAWSTVLQIVALTGLASSVLTWLILRLTKPLDSYTEEFAKRVARYQNLDKLVEETRLITDAAEKIKSGLLQENWDRQTRWTAKRDLYVEIAKALGDLRRADITMKGLERLRLTRNLADPKYGPELQAKRRDALRAMEEASVNFQRAIDTAPLLIPDGPFKPLREFKPREIRFDTPHWEEDFEYNIQSTQWALYHFQTAARADLGFEPMIWKPTIWASEYLGEDSRQNG
jgi:hypothetical protein